VGEPLIAGGGPSGNRSLMESVNAHIDIDLDWRHEVQHIPTAIEWTAAGIAHTIAPRLAVGDTPAQTLKCLEITSPPISRRIGILQRTGERMAPAAESLRRSIAAALRRKLAPERPPDRRQGGPIFVRLGQESSLG